MLTFVLLVPYLLFFGFLIIEDIKFALEDFYEIELEPLKETENDGLARLYSFDEDGNCLGCEVIENFKLK